MTSISEKTLTLPTSSSENKNLTSEQSIILVGANGSGKTRLGTWIEMSSPQRKLVHRISAQKSLEMPDSTTPMSIEHAENDLLLGYALANKDQHDGYKNGHKWANRPAISMLNDFQKLMVYLFSDESEENAKYKAQQKLNSIRVEPPKTKLDFVKELWEKTLPHRELIIGGLRIQTCVKGSPEKLYNSSEMSDGERVIFYLIGQCLAAPNNGIIVLDEPELHLHKSVQIPLWLEIEKLRQDCLFVYLTHDVEFAAAKENSKRVWLKSFDGENWNWEELLEDNNLPSSLLLEVLGSRKPVVFVEGENGSHDVSLYRAILPSFLVIPRGSCTQVIQSVKALKDNTQLHHLEVYGIIDRDRRVQNEVDALEKDSIFVLGVAEVENLFCTKEILAIVSSRLARDIRTDFTSACKIVFTRLRSELETQVSMHVAGEVKFQLNFFDEKAKGTTAIKAALEDLCKNIDIDQLYESTLANFNSAINANDYDKLLLIYNRKKLSSQVGTALGLANAELPELVVRLARSDDNATITKALLPYFGNFNKHISK